MYGDDNWSKGMFGLCIFDTQPYSLGGRGFVGFNIDLVLLEMLILVFCAIVLVGSLLSFLYTLPERRFLIFFFLSDVFMTTFMLLLSVGSMMSVSLFRS